MQASKKNHSVDYTQKYSTSPFRSREEAIQANIPIIEKVKAVVQAFERKYHGRKGV